MIRISGLRKKLGGREVLRGVDLEIYEGTTTTILGISGCGKTTLLKHVIGLHKADEGTVEVKGVDMSRAGREEVLEERRKIGMVFQNAALLQSLSVMENVSLPLYENTRMRVPEILKIARQKLALVRLSGYEDYSPANLSGGMRKRAGVARAIVTDPDIILYDEPTTGLDPIITNTVNELITDMKQKLQVTSVVISHDIPSAMRTSDYVAILHNGRIFAYGTPEEVGGSSDPVVQQFLRGDTKGPITDMLWGDEEAD
ncbi:MAG: ATP-binding cassette domain-containing protein [Planctomycetes bacterium]|nr:ATP-binding cassette domain-containing protein [Planctomycetota bacterium]